MSLNYVLLTLDLYDGSGAIPDDGTAVFTPSAVLTDAGVEVAGQMPVTATFTGTVLPQVRLLATDNAGPLPAGWAWNVSFTGLPGSPAPFSFFLPYSAGASQVLSALVPVSPATQFQAFGAKSPLAFASAYNGAGPYYAAHRSGGSSQGGFYQGPYPEEFTDGFRAVVAATGGGIPINPHVRMLADGALVCMHDSTPDRTTTASGSIPVSDYTTPAWHQLTGDPQNWVGYGVNWGTIYPPLFEQILAEFGGRVLIQAEADSGGWQATGTVAAAITALAQKYSVTDCIMISSFQAAELTPAANAGIHTLYATPAYGASGYDAPSIAAAMTSGWAPGVPKRVVINPGGGTQAQITAWVQSLTAAPYNYQVWAAVPIRRSDLPWLQAAGVTGFVTDEPVYLPGTAASPSAQDPTALSATWPHGALPASNIALSRGNVQHGGIQLDYINTGGSQTLYQVLGWLCPVKAAPYTISTSITWDTADSDSTRWASLLFCCPDDTASTGLTGGSVNGYQVLFRQSGQIQLFKITAPSGSAQVGANQATQAITGGQVVLLTVNVTSTQIIISATVNGTPYGPFTFTDSTYRGGYIHIGKAHSGTPPKLIVTFKNTGVA